MMLVRSQLSSPLLLLVVVAFLLLTVVAVEIVEEDSLSIEEQDGSLTKKKKKKKKKKGKQPQAWTLDGIPLYAKTFHGLEKAGLDAQLSISWDDLHGTNPKGDPAKHVWYGRRLAYQWRYRKALDVYSRALAMWPDDAPLHRHCGHIYITTRNFTKAQHSLQKASDLIVITNSTNKDTWEPDGKPNQYNLPLYSRHYNIYYHLGLSQYLQGNFKGAIKTYDLLMNTLLQNNNNNNNNYEDDHGIYTTKKKKRKKKKKTKFFNDDAVAAAVYWKYMALRRAGYGAHTKRVKRTLKWIHPNMKVLDVDAYLQMCYFFKGMGPQPAFNSTTNPLDFATLGYGIGNYYYFNGNQKQAIQVWNQVVQNSTYWPAFGFIAAEADLYRLKLNDDDDDDDGHQTTTRDDNNMEASAAVAVL